MHNVYVILTIIVIIIAIYDCRYYRLPNWGVWAIGLLSFMPLASWSYGIVQTIHGVALGILFWLLKYSTEHLWQRPTLGWGDVKLAISCGLWLTYPSIPFFLIFTGVNGIIIAILWQRWYQTPYFPLGAAMGLGLLQTLLWGAYQ